MTWTQKEIKTAGQFIDVYKDLYAGVYDVKVVVNKVKAKWDIMEVIDDLGYDRAIRTLAYYMTLRGSHRNTLKFFVNNYERLVVAMENRERDKQRTLDLLELTRQRVEAEGG